MSAVATSAFVQRLAGQGLRVREYRLPRGGSVNCTVAPDDDLLVTHLEAPLARRAAHRRGDAVVARARRRSTACEDVPFDPQAGEVLYLPKIAAVKQQPAYTFRVTLLSVEPGGAREIGRYAFRHSPWPG